MIIRPAKLDDVDRLYQFSQEIPPGMTSMPNDRGTWESKLKLAEKSFCEGDAGICESRIFFLVLEDAENNLLGTTGIHTQIGIKRPFYNYKVSKQVMASESLGVTVRCEILSLVNDFTGATELTSLYLNRQARVKPVGQVLSRCRFLLMHDFPHFFGNMVFAEIRGWLNDQDTSPFWEHIGNKFFNMPYKKADFISAVNGSQFISDLMPRYPIYLNLLPDEAQNVVGKPHDDALPAQRLLEREGFGYRDYVDIFDAGPVLQCELDKIFSVQEAQQAVIQDIVDDLQNSSQAVDLSQYIVSNRSLNHYRIAFGNIQHTPENGVIVDKQLAEKINVAQGSTISVLAIR